MRERITIENNEEYLRRISTEVDFKKDDIKSYLADLKEFCQSSECYALAPVQIGIPKRIIYIRNTSSNMDNNFDENYNEDIVYINPVIKNMYGHTRFLEGCGSCKYADGRFATGVIDRPYKIEIEYYDIEGNKKAKTIEGFESTVFCHEYDHLNGILHMDRAKETSKLFLEQMREFRLNNPYDIISKDDTFTYEEVS